MKKSTMILIALVAIVAIWGVSAYNGLVKMDESVNTAWSNVENQYQRRADLIPNLVSTVKGYAAHEKETLEAVMAARSKATQMTIDPGNLTPEKLQEIKGQKARVALIGTGSRGRYHIHNLFQIPHAEIVAICDDYEPHLKLGAELCPNAKQYTDYRKLLEDKDIDGVIISTPLGWHARMVLDSLAAGKHVFCEKAMARTMEECKAIYDAYQLSDKALYFCMQRMYDEKYIKGVQMIREGLVGDIVGMRCHWFRNADWRRECPSPEFERRINWRLYKESSGGLMTELGTHQLEVCNWVMDRILGKI